MAHMSQAEIDALLKDSMFEDSDIQEPKQPQELQQPEIQSHKKLEDSGQYGSEAFESYEESRRKEEKNVEQSQHYGSQQFESYEESKRTFSKNVPKPIQNDKRQPLKTKLTDIREEASPQATKTEKNSKEKPKSKTGINFYPPKQTNPAPSYEKKNLPYNFVRLQQRQKELLLTTLTEESRQLKEDARKKESQYKKLESAYRMILQDKAQQTPSVRETTLEKQLSTLQSKYQKMQNLFKMERERNKFKSTAKTHHQTFIPEEQASQREQEHLNLIDQLKDRLISSNNELKTLQAKMNDGQNYIDELKRKMKRVEQLQFKMQKMTQQAQNDRQYIRQLRDKNAQLQEQLFEAQKEKRLMEVQIRRYQLGQQTQKDTLSELSEVKKEKQMLQRSLRDLAGNMNNFSKRSNQVWGKIEDSGELLNPK